MPKTSFLQKKERNRPFLAKVTDSLPGQKAEVTSQIKLPKLDLPTFDGDIHFIGRISGSVQCCSI